MVGDEIMWYNSGLATDEVRELQNHFKINLFQAVTLLDKGYTSKNLIKEYGELPKEWLLALLD
jgi:hypothetical protein